MKLSGGQTLGGFEIIEQIGRGAMGVVYRARQLALERDVALKVLDLVDDPSAFERFRREAIQVANLKHPNILPVFDFGQQDDVTYIAMELADGGTLKTLIGHPTPVERAIQILTPAAEAIDYAHLNNIVHRDVKPANLLFDADGRLFLSDFGLALMRDAKSSTWGAMVGTPWYMAPEQFRGRAVPASDIYSLAVTLYQLLTGHVPFERENPLAVALAHLRDAIPPARGANPEVTESVDRVLRRGMAKNPAERFKSALELLSAVRQAFRQPAQAPAAAAASAPPRPAAPTTADPKTAAPLPRVSGRPDAGRVQAPLAAALAAARSVPGAPAGPAQRTTPPGASQPPVLQSSLGSAQTMRQAPTPGRQIFESKATPEWTRANVMLKDSAKGKVAVNGEVIEVTLGPGNQAQMMAMQVGVVQDVWAELQFGVASEGGLFDLLWHEGTSKQSYCARVDTQVGRVSIGLVQASGPGEERWLTARNAPLSAGSDHTLLLVASKGSIDVYLDGKELALVKDATLSQGMVRLRMLPSPQTATSKLLLRRTAFYRPPD